MKAQHTPGPWNDLGDCTICSTKINKYGNFIITQCQRENTEEDKANAKLIAAAPELHEWLQAVVSQGEAQLKCGDSHVTLSRNTLDLIKKSIAKVQGE